MTQELPPAEPLPALTDPQVRSDAEPTLKQAMRRARFDDAERMGVQVDLRASQIVRLEMLQEALKPLLAQVPSAGTDLFDVGIMPGTTPRLFIDMIGFIEIGRDSRTYRLLQDARHGRLTIAESADVPTMVSAVTEYVARRLLDREKALAAESRTPDAVAPATGKTEGRQPDTKGPGRRLAAVFGFVIDLLGAVAFFAILTVTGWYLWSRLHGRM